MWTRENIEVGYTAPIDLDALWDYWGARTIARVEQIDARTYRRSVHLAGGPAILEFTRENGQLSAAVLASHPGDTDEARALIRRTIDADLDPQVIQQTLGVHPWLGTEVHKRPGLRAPHHPGWFEVTLRAILAQQISLKAARTHTARLIAAVGSELTEPVGEITHVFPTPAQVATLASDDGEVLAMPTRRRHAVLNLAERAAAGFEVEGLPAPEAEKRLQSLPGIGAWTAAYVRMRALDDPDGFCGSDLILRRQAEALGGGALDPRGVEFAPWRTYAAHHIWRSAYVERQRKETT